MVRVGGFEINVVVDTGGGITLRVSAPEAQKDHLKSIGVRLGVSHAEEVETMLKKAIKMVKAIEEDQ